MEEDGRNSPPPQQRDTPDQEESEQEESQMVEGPVSAETQQREGHVTMNLLSVMPKEKPPLNVVGDVHGRIAIIVVSEKVGSNGG